METTKTYNFMIWKDSIHIWDTSFMYTLGECEFIRFLYDETLGEHNKFNPDNDRYILQQILDNTNWF